jgi:AAA15 family ATPase/GTPase
MVASRELRHKEHLTIAPALNLKVLPTAAIYGGNGSGKSNFCLALQFARDLILKPKISEDDSIDVEPFRLDEKSDKEPTTFAFEVLVGSEVFKYSFAVTRNRVREESLRILKGNKAGLVYSRGVVEDKDDWDLDYFENLKLRKEEAEFIKFKARDTLPSQLFLNALRGRKIPIADSLTDWFKNVLTLMGPNTNFKTMEFTRTGRENLRGYCIETLNRSHTGIDKIDGEEVPFETADIPTKLKTMIKDQLKENVSFDLVGPEKRYSVFLENGQLKCRQLVTYHHARNGNLVRFEVSDESAGTQRLIDLLPAFYELVSNNSQKVFVIDELDRSLHTLLTRDLLESYLASRQRESKGQLIFTTHDGLLLDQAVFRRDEFWFIDKDEDGASSLASLSDFKDVRHDKDIRKSYLLGRFGGIPIIRSSPRSTNGSRK